MNLSGREMQSTSPKEVTVASTLSLIDAKLDDVESACQRLREAIVPVRPTDCSPEKNSYAIPAPPPLLDRCNTHLGRLEMIHQLLGVIGKTLG